MEVAPALVGVTLLVEVEREMTPVLVELTTPVLEEVLALELVILEVVIVELVLWVKARS